MFLLLLPFINCFLIWSGTSEVFTEITSAVVVLFGLVWWLEVAVLFSTSLYLRLEVPVSRRYRQATLALPRLGPGHIDRGLDLFLYSRNWCILANRRHNRHIDKLSTDYCTLSAINILVHLVTPFKK